MSSKNSTESLGCSKLFDPCDKIPNFEIDDAIRKALCFQERLIVSLKDDLTSDTKPVGGYCISVQGLGSEGQEFMIQVLSSLTANDRFAGLKVIGSTTAKLHCLEEKRTEYVYKCDGLHEKRIFLGLEDDIYHLEGEDLCPCDKSSWKKDLPLCSNGEIISEGTSMLLMRYLALTNYHGNLSFQSIMIDGQLTTCNYRCSEAKHVKFHGHLIEVYTIERRMHEECGLIHNIKTYMTRNGYILRHDWLEEKYLLQINSLTDPNILGTMEPKINAPLRSRWGSDVEMMSMYLDEKTCKMAQQVKYITNHPEIERLISDYTQALIAVKPTNVLTFTIQHFAAFAKHAEPLDIDWEDKSNVEIMSQLSRYEPKGKICSVCGICFDCLMSEQPGHDRQTQCPGYPVVDQGLSLCSVFSVCPSDATCVRKLSECSVASSYCSTCRLDRKNLSVFNLHPDCEKMCKICQASSESCKLNEKKLDVCDVESDCELTCKGCQALKEACKCVGKSHDVCNIQPDCEKTCEGCLFLKVVCKCARIKPSICSFELDCEKKCEGCQAPKKACKCTRNKLSDCAFDLACERTCDGCKKGHAQKKHSTCSFDDTKCERRCIGCLAVKQLRDRSSEKQSSCNLRTDCETTCKGCELAREEARTRDKNKKSTCSVHSDCGKTCEGCRAFKEGPIPHENKQNFCKLRSDCKITCEGCRLAVKEAHTLDENKQSVCSFHPQCETRCDGCQTERDDRKENEKKFSTCILYPECEETCKGCETLRETCPVHKACPECPGCHQVCNEIRNCPNCRKCNIEILPDITTGNCMKKPGQTCRK